MTPEQDAERKRLEQIRAVRDEIRLRSEVLRAFPDAVLAVSPEGDEANMQRERFLWLLRRERELMGEEWVTG